MLVALFGQGSGVSAQMTNVVLGAVLPFSGNLSSMEDLATFKLALDLGTERVNRDYLNALGYNLSIVYR